MSVQYDFASNNFHVAPGDVLLLKSSGKGVANRGGQWVQRRRQVRFTHVAVVVDATKIVDAMPKVGVSFRLWRDIERKYDIEKSVVARHAGLANDPKVRERVYLSGLYFFKQPYRLSTVIRDPGAIRHESGMVCSHFVAGMMRRLGVRISEQRDTSSLPVDIDTYTRSAPEWRQFSLQEYGLFSKAPRPTLSDEYWAAMHEANLSQLSAEDRAAFERPSSLPPVEVPTTLLVIDEWIKKSDDILLQSQEINQQIEDKFQVTTELQHSISRQVTEFEKLMLSLSEALAASSPEARETSLKLLQSGGPLAGEMEPLTGAFFHGQWDALYRAPIAPPIFIHQDAAAETRERQRALLRHSVKQARGLAANQIGMFNDLAEAMKKFSAAIEKGPVAAELVESLAAWADMVYESGWFLRGEEIQVVRARADHLDESLAAVVDWAKTCGLEERTILQAYDLYEDISMYDLDVLQWLGLQRVLLKIRDTLRIL